MRTGGQRARRSDREISRFPYKERPHMPGSPTTPGRPGTRADAPVRVAFRHANSVGTRDSSSFAAQWLAYALPCRRFAHALADARRTARGRCGSLLLHRSGLSPPTPCRSPGALTVIPSRRPLARRGCSPRVAKRSRSSGRLKSCARCAAMARVCVLHSAMLRTSSMTVIVWLLVPIKRGNAPLCHTLYDGYGCNERKNLNETLYDFGYRRTS